MLPSIYHWRKHGGGEIDILLEYNGYFYPIVVKLKTKPSRMDVKGYYSFKNTYPDIRIAPGFFICATEKAYMITKDVLAVPWDLI